MIFHSGWNNGWELRLRFIAKPDFLILDEPITVSILSESREFRQMIKRSTMNSATILTSSHILSELYLAANRFGIVESRTPDQRNSVRWPEESKEKITSSSRPAS